MGRLETISGSVMAAAGQVLRAGTRLVATRPAAKPLHPVGSLRSSVLRRSGSVVRSGVAWLDEAGEDQALVRLSRSVGLPRGLPDVFGLAMRITRDGHHGDLLLSSTGMGPVSRFVLLPTRRLDGRPMSTLLPYRSPAGPLVIAATSQGTDTFLLSWAVGRSAWHPFGTLELGERVGDGNEDLSFDPVLNVLPGLEHYDSVRRLREPSYSAARRSRSA
jgi:hypothetical protein